MIDTDKYEGHSEGEWKVGARKGAMTVRDSNGEEIAATNSYSNAQLIADAPLLLEEVERHRPPKVDGKYMAWSDSHPKHDRRTWIEQVIEGVTDVGYWTWVNWQLQYGDEEE